MKRFVPAFFLASLCLVLFTACSRSSDPGSQSCTGPLPAADSSALLTFAKIHGITNLKDTLGLYYQVVSQGTGAALTAKSTIFVTYTGTLLDSTVFDSATDPSKTGFLLSGLIYGWQLGIPEIQVGGHIKMLIPSQYGYGCLGSNSIPPNAPIFFDVTVVSAQ